MNYAEATTVIIAITTSLSGPLAAHAKGAPWWLVIGSVIPSLLLGIGIGYISGRVAFTVLMRRSSGLATGILFTLYIILPMLFLVGGMLASFLTMDWLTQALTMK